MVPVAVLPAAAVLMGIGYWIDPSGWGGDSAIAAFLIKAGAAIIDNMGILFALGVAFGMSKDKDEDLKYIFDGNGWVLAIIKKLIYCPNLKKQADEI